MNLSVLKQARAAKEAEQAKSEQMDTRELSASGSIIWTDSGLNQDMPTFAKVHSPNANKDAAEIVRRWNAFPELVAKLQELCNIATHPQATKEAIKMIAREATETLRNIETK